MAGKNKHRGVWTLERRYEDRVVIVARWMDPDLKVERQQSLTDLGLTTVAAREAWMVEKAREIKERRKALRGGATPHTGATIPETLDLYFAEKGKEISEETRKSYRAAADKFNEWARLAGVRRADDLRPDHLAAFTTWLRGQRARVAVKGGRRNERAASDRECSPGGLNNRLRSIRAILNELRRTGRLPHITFDALKDRIKLSKGLRTRPGYLRTAQVLDLLAAAMRHDAETFTETRDEHARGSKGVKGATPRYDPIAPFVAYMLLTGCRLEEALGIKWSSIDFDAKNELGRKVGEIVLRASEVKTGHERSIDLGVSPTLRKLLAAMKLKAGGAPYVFGSDKPWTRSKVEAARRRLIAEFGAPRFCWAQTEGDTPALRATCGTFLTNAPGIYGGSAAWHSAKRLGHSVTIAEKHYAGHLKGLPRRAKTLEAAMGIEKRMADVVARMAGPKVPRVADHPPAPSGQAQATA